MPLEFSTPAPLRPSASGSPDLERRSFLLRALAAASVVAGVPAGVQAQGGGGTVIDIHQHIYPPDYVRENLPRLLEDNDELPASFYLNWSPAQALEQMDRAGVRTAITSIANPGVWFAEGLAGRLRARDCNDYGARLVADHPGRFGMFAAIPLPDTEGSLQEINHALDSLRLDGVGLLSSYAGKWLGDASFAPVFEELNRRQAVVFVHPTTPCCSRPVPGTRPVQLEYSLDMPRTMASLLLSGTLVRYPRIRFVFAHAGGSMAANLSRLNYVVARMTPEQRATRAPRGAEFELQRHFFDVANVAQNPPWVEGLRALVPASQVLFGSDSPFTSSMLVSESLPDLGLSTEHLARLRSSNALQLFPRLRG